jgi:hypothetical protein
MWKLNLKLGNCSCTKTFPSPPEDMVSRMLKPWAPSEAILSVLLNTCDVQTYIRGHESCTRDWYKVFENFEVAFCIDSIWRHSISFFLYVRKISMN